MVSSLAEGPAIAARAAGSGLCLGEHQLPFPGRAGPPVGWDGAWDAQPFTVTRATPARGRPLWSQRPLCPQPAWGFITLRSPPPHGPGMWGSGEPAGHGGPPGRGGARPPPLPEGQGGAAPHVGVAPSQPCTLGRARGRTRPPVSYFWAEAQIPFLSLAARGGGGHALSPCPSLELSGFALWASPWEVPRLAAPPLPLCPPHLPITHPAQHDAHRA